MSGHKKATVNISQEEFDRLRRLDLEQNNFADSKNLFESNIKNEYQVLLKSYEESLSQRFIDFQNTIQAMDRGIREADEESNRIILDSQNEILSLLQNTLQQESDYEDFVSQLLDKFTERLDQIEISRSQESFVDQDTLVKIIRESHAKNDLAMKWIRDARSHLEFIDDHYEHKFFFPGKVDELIQDLKTSQEYFSHGLYDSVVMTSQQIIKSVNKLQLDLEKIQVEYLLKYQFCESEIKSLISYLESIEEIYAIDLEGNILPYQINTNYWTEGKYLEIIFQLQNLFSQFNSQDTIISITDLDTMIEINLPELKNVIRELPINAQISVINSQIRINIADVMVQALVTQGYVVESNGYEGGNLFSPYIIKMTNLARNEVIIDVSPNHNHPLQNEFNIFTHNPEKYTQNELNRRAIEIIGALRSHGLEVGPMNVETIPSVQPDNLYFQTNSPKIGKTDKNDLRTPPHIKS